MLIISIYLLYQSFHSKIVLNLITTLVCNKRKKLVFCEMSKKKIKKNTQSNLKIFEFSPGNIIDGVNKNVGNFFQTLKKDREKNKLRREKEKKNTRKKRNSTTKEASSER